MFKKSNHTQQTDMLKMAVCFAKNGIVTAIFYMSGGLPEYHKSCCHSE